MANIYGETYYAKFTPDIKHEAPDVTFLDAFGVPYNGIAAPTLNGMAAAVWVGRQTNRYLEFPVLLACVHPKRRKLDGATRWFVGVSTEQNIEAIAETLDSAHPLVAAQASAADVRVPNLHTGVGYLKRALGFPMAHYVAIQSAV